MRVEFKFRKLREAYQSHGRGRDSTRTPAVWALLANGEHIATLSGERVQYMEPASWQVATPAGRPLVIGLASRAAALEWTKQNLLAVLRAGADPK